MLDIQDTYCCGVKELDGISAFRSAKQVMGEFYNEITNNFNCPPIILFTGVSKKGYAQKLKLYIKRNKLGAVVNTKPVKNPNSGNLIEAFLWTVNYKALEKWSDNINK